jgi:4-hydroxy-4-methyl-2-oxoglutarate aldolase
MTVRIHDNERFALTPHLMKRWSKIPTAIIADVSDDACLIDPSIRPLRPAGAQPRLFGRAVTARCVPPDFGAVLRAIDFVVAGDVLVIDAQGMAGPAMIGGILGGHLRRKGAAGIVCNGAVRDVGELAGLKNFAVYARFVTPRGPSTWAHGEVNGPLNISGGIINPGDLIIGDDDGLVALDEEATQALISKAEEKLALEGKWIAELKSGKSLAKVFKLDG